jgi:hypothetical protein
MKKLIALFILGLAAGVLSAQTTTFSATITDSDGTPWANGTWQAVIYSPLAPPQFNGALLSPTTYSGTMNSSGVLSQVLPSNSSITPSGSQWRFTLCPNASASCSSVLITVTGTTQDGSGALSAATSAPRFSAGPYAYGYIDAEVAVTPLPGGVYFNVETQLQRIWNGVNWSNQGGGGGGGCSTFPCLTGTIATSQFPATLTFGSGLVINESGNALTAGTFTGGNFVGNGSGLTALSAANISAGILGIANGGTATATPGLIAGTNVTITGTWPNETINSTATGITGLTTGFIPQAASSTSLTNSVIDVGVTTASTVTSTDNISAPVVIATGGIPGASSGGGYVGTDVVGTPTGVSGSGILYFTPTAANVILNAGTSTPLALTGVDINTSNQVVSTHLTSPLPVAQDGTGTATAAIANVTITLPTTAIAATTCTSASTTTMTGLATTSAFMTAFATDPSAVTGWGSAGGLSWVAWPTANTLNWRVCNVTASSITPGAMSLNVGAR